jgi:Fe-Mn family superoxide dismutase
MIREIIKKSLALNEAVVSNIKSFALKTEFLSQGNKDNHIELYKAYVNASNEISAKLDSVDKSEVNGNHSQFRSLKLDEAFNQNGVVLHELYFENISDLASEIAMDNFAYIKLSSDYGTFDAWQKDFLACCQASRCGWAVTGLNIFTGKYQNIMIDLHSQNVPVGIIPVIVMDVWQHAYYRDYLKEVKTYSSAMMKELNWNVIEKRIQLTEQIKSLTR